MAKLPGRIPAAHVESATGWQLPQIEQDSVTQLIKLMSRSQPAKMRLSKTAPKSSVPKAPVPKAPVADQSADSSSQAINQSPALAASVAEPERQPERQSKQQIEVPDQSITEEVQGEAARIDQASAQADAPEKTEGEGFEEGFRKGETEGFVKGEKSGYDVGLAAGTEVGRQQAEAAFNEEVASQRSVITALQQAFVDPPNIDAEIQQELVTLITELTKTIVAREIKTQPEMIRDLVTKALLALPHGADKPRVFVNPSDVELLQSISHQDVEFIADAGLARGGCRVLAGQSSVEAGVSLRVREALLAACRGETVPMVTEAEMQDLEKTIEVKDDGAE